MHEALKVQKGYGCLMMSMAYLWTPWPLSKWKLFFEKRGKMKDDF